jgi:hypothetical protein
MGESSTDLGVGVSGTSAGEVCWILFGFDDKAFSPRVCNRTIIAASQAEVTSLLPKYFCFLGTNLTTLWAVFQQPTPRDHFHLSERG